jgi:hypothetical protein
MRRAPARARSDSFTGEASARPVSSRCAVADVSSPRDRCGRRRCPRTAKRHAWLRFALCGSAARRLRSGAARRAAPGAAARGRACLSGCGGQASPTPIAAANPQDLRPSSRSVSCCLKEATWGAAVSGRLGTSASGSCEGSSCAALDGTKRCVGGVWCGHRGAQGGAGGDVGGVVLAEQQAVCRGCDREEEQRCSGQQRS